MQQGASRLPEFIIKITHPDTAHTTKIYFHLHTMSIQSHIPLTSAHLPHHRFPRTYPTNAHPIFTVQQPIKGIPDDCVIKLADFIQAEARQSRGTEIVFQVSNLYIGSWRMGPAFLRLFFGGSTCNEVYRNLEPHRHNLVQLILVIFRSSPRRKIGLPLISHLLWKLSVLWPQR